MDFDALRKELEVNPAGLKNSDGVPLTTLYDKGNDTGAAALLNLPQDGADYIVPRRDIQPREVIQAITPDDFGKMLPIVVSKLQLFFLSAPIDCSLPNVAKSLAVIMSGLTPETQQAVAALCIRQGSRAEILFGVFVTETDIAKARG